MKKVKWKKIMLTKKLNNYNLENLFNAMRRTLIEKKIIQMKKSLEKGKNLKKNNILCYRKKCDAKR